jgi:hypothetical protein
MNALFAGLLLLPMTIAIGMTYPLAVRILARDAEDVLRPAPVSTPGTPSARSSVAGGRIRADSAAQV